MPKVRNGKKGQKGAVPAPPATPISFTQLEESRRNLTATHLRSANTNAVYQGILKRARLWIWEWVNDSALRASVSETELGQQLDRWESPEFAHGFDPIPNIHSPDALSLYLAFKCAPNFENCGIGTADQTRAAFKALWDEA
jgi:hypothetical protein